MASEKQENNPHSAHCFKQNRVSHCHIYNGSEINSHAETGMGSITFESNILQLQLLCIGPITITITITFENHHPYYNYNYF